MRRQQSSISKISSLGIESKQCFQSENFNAKDSSYSSISLHYELQKSSSRYMNKQNMDNVSKMTPVQNIMNKQYGIREYFKQRKQKVAQKELEGSAQRNCDLVLKGYQECRSDLENMIAEIQRLLGLMRKEEVIKQIRSAISEKTIENNGIKKRIQKNEKLIIERGSQRHQNQAKVNNLREMLKQKANQYNENKEKLLQLSEQYIRVKNKTDNLQQMKEESRCFYNTIKPNNEINSKMRKKFLSNEYYQNDIEGFEKITRSSQSSLNKKLSKLKVQNETQISKIINSFEFPMRVSIDYSQQYPQVEHKKEKETYQMKYKSLLKQRVKLLNNSISSIKQEFNKKAQRLQSEKSCIKKTVQVVKLAILNFQNKSRKMRASWARKNFFSLPTQRFKSISQKSSGLQMNSDQIPTNKNLANRRESNKSRSSSRQKLIKLAWNKHLLETATEEVLEQWQESPQKEDRYNIIHQFGTGQENDESKLIY